MSTTSDTSARSGGIGFVALLTIAFIVLKLTGVTAWSWLWVLSPIWITAAATLLVFVVLLVGVIVADGRRR